MATPRKTPAKSAPNEVTDTQVPPAAPVETSPAPVAVLGADMPALDTVLQETAEKAIAGAKDIQENIRRAAEDGLAQTRAAYEKLKIVAEEATGSIETSYSTATRGFGEINLKALEAMKSQADASFEHMKALIASKSISEAMTLQSEHLRKQFETLSGQAKDLAALTQKIATDAVEPLKATFNKGFAA